MNYEVPVSYIDLRIFDSQIYQRGQHYEIKEKVMAWLDCYAGDWGVKNLVWTRIDYTAYGIKDKSEIIGKVFQFGTQRQACLFKLVWNLPSI